jgi:hypothetical protein
VDAEVLYQNSNQSELADTLIKFSDQTDLVEATGVSIDPPAE